MSGFELIPMHGGDAIQLPPGETVLGRGPFLRVSLHRQCVDNVRQKTRDTFAQQMPAFSSTFALHFTHFLLLLGL